MPVIRCWNRVLLVFIVAQFFALAAHAMTAAQALAVAVGESDERIAALAALVQSPEPQTLQYLQALSEGKVKIVANAPVVLRDGKALDAATGATLALSADVLAGAPDAMVNNRLRGEIDNALSALQLLSPLPSVRRDAVKALQGQVGEAQIPLIETAIAKETEADIGERLALLRAGALLGSEDAALAVLVIDQG